MKIALHVSDLALATFVQLITESYSDFSTATPLTISYYDNYNFIPAGNNLNYDSSQEQNGYTAYYSNAKGLLTGTRVYHLNDPNASETTAIYYDKYGRVVQSRATNHLLGYDLVYNELKFTGTPARTLKTHNIAGQASVVELYTYAYDKAQRLTTTKYSLNGGSLMTMAVNSYDELGRLSSKKLGGIDATTYSYNIRSWTTGISGTRFSENLYYNANTANLPTFTACYNGNIAGMQWNVPNEGLGYNRTYTFGYDGLNRLTDANYCGFNGSVVGGTSGKYDEHTGFDKMGNFTALTRNENGSLLNNLSFAYKGNQLKKVDNAVSPYIPYGSEAFNDKQKIDTEYYYDQNGSTTADVNTGISLIQYNLLNLPDQIQFTEGHKNMYTYDASGRKLKAVNYTVHNIVNVPINTISTLPSNPSDYTKLTTDYVGNMIYENGSLKQILLPEGYYQGGIYYYYLKDHLGDNRVVINSSGSVIEKSHYYPSGMRFSPESTSNSAALPYRYNGKELESMNGLNQYDYSARRRGAGLPVWTAVDPLAELNVSISPYVYCSDNYINRIDPTGLYDLKEVTVVGHRPRTNYSSSFYFQDIFPYSGRALGGTASFAKYAQVTNALPNIDVNKNWLRYAANKFSKLEKAEELGLKSGAIYQKLKGLTNLSSKLPKAIKGLGIAGNILSAAQIALDVSDGSIKPSSIATGGLLAVGLIFAGPEIVAGLAIYGVADAALDLGGKLDKGFDNKELKLNPF